MTLRDGYEDVAPLKLEAFDWAARLAIGPVSEDDRRAFDAWHAASPAHAEAYRGVADFMDGLRALKLPLEDAGERPANDNRIVPKHTSGTISRRAFMSGGAVAASVAAGVIAVRSPLGLWPTLAEIMADERTVMGERKTFTPLAGVDVELNSRSSLSWTPDGARLIAGEMFVSVDQSTRGFHIEAGDVRTATHKAMFNVSDIGTQLCVTCVEGEVSTERGGQRIGLGAGEAVTWLADGRMERAEADPAAAGAWRKGLLVFRGTPLATAIGEINRYYPGRLVLRGSALNARPVTGVFHVDQIELALVQIQQLTRVSATHLPGGVVLLG